MPAVTLGKGWSGQPIAPNKSASWVAELWLGPSPWPCRVSALVGSYVLEPEVGPWMWDLSAWLNCYHNCLPFTVQFKWNSTPAMTSNSASFYVASFICFNFSFMALASLQCWWFLHCTHLCGNRFFHWVSEWQFLIAAYYPWFLKYISSLVPDPLLFPDYVWGCVSSYITVCVLRPILY